MELALSKAVRRDWEAAVVQTTRLETEVFIPAEQEINRVVGELALSSKLNISHESEN